MLNPNRNKQRFENGEHHRKCLSWLVVWPGMWVFLVFWTRFSLLGTTSGCLFCIPLGIFFLFSFCFLLPLPFLGLVAMEKKVLFPFVEVFPTFGDLLIYTYPTHTPHPTKKKKNHCTALVTRTNFLYLSKQNVKAFSFKLKYLLFSKKKVLYRNINHKTPIKHLKQKKKKHNFFF